MKKIIRKWWIIGSLFFTLFMIILWVPTGRAEEKPKLAILAFFIEREGVCPICRTVFRRGEILPGSQNTLTRLLYQKIEAKGVFKVLPLEKVEGALSNWDRKQFDEKPVASSIQLGKELNADFLFIGFLFRFEERIGSSMGVEKPASVGFDLHLLRLKDGVDVWKGKMDETQRPLSENILKIGSFLRRKAHWLTAEELASVGMDEILERLPGAKELEEK
jgi:hypothetical protein